MSPTSQGAPARFRAGASGCAGRMRRTGEFRPGGRAAG
ncbi:hypothetical protein SFR_5459 [Streptomyces sp. FR-008]|nr:hypothetical protein SFR_5459 [Streptomyces sp. FR-008]